MKKLLFLLLSVLTFAFASTANANPHHQDWSDSFHDRDNWRSANYEKLPFRWHEQRNNMKSRYHMERIHNAELSNRFPGLRAYQWRDTDGRGFIYQGHRVTNAVLFYNRSNELVAVGFMNHGTFVFMREDYNGYQTHDSFYISWFRG